MTRWADRHVADEHRVGEAAPGDALGQRRVEREPQAVADDRLVQRRVPLVQRHRGELDVEIADGQLLPEGATDMHGLAGDCRLCTHARTSFSTAPQALAKRGPATR
jgi:hypothetical protein